MLQQGGKGWRQGSGLGGQGTASRAEALPTHLYTSRMQVAKKETPTVNR